MAYSSRSDFPAQLPGTSTSLCWSCKQPGVEQVIVDGQKRYRCGHCGRTNERFLAYDPGMASYFDDAGRLIHESAGVIPVRADGKLLLFKRTKYPYLLTAPAGHLSMGEDPEVAAVRETAEEIGIGVKGVRSVFDGLIEGDACVGGADIHHWHAYVAVVSPEAVPKLAGDEGAEWGWYEPASLSEDNAVQPLVYLLRQPGVRAALRPAA